MRTNLRKAAKTLSDRAETAGQRGRIIPGVEFERLASDLGLTLPTWMFDLFTSIPLSGLRLGWQCSQPDEDYDGIATVLWSNASDIRSESIGCYPGLAIRAAGYVNVGCCAHGSGNPYFVNITEGSDPPLYQVQHDVSDQAEVIISKARQLVAPRLSRFFETAILAGER
jgi:hypothetical protein